ncbi:hypothetical protein [Curtobacterium sp. MCBA15_004]|uniref:hypothetical protein n=1 Tax=Curtobacterium sp. MCBA15_004 TaxID=1898733 RepID=UPI0020C89FA3|nr:hypothetical protein [Curtobacterium sp. MCBA15_004]WIA98085.1 hypothetical protein QOL16_06765 [Curtobacterium sp. MCBA15_004]
MQDHPSDHTTGGTTGGATGGGVDHAASRPPAPTGPVAPPAATDQDALARSRALAVLRAAALGDRLVVRARHGDGARDALGVLTARTASTVTVDNRRGPVEVPLDDVVAAKPVPPPPERRPRRAP